MKTEIWKDIQEFSGCYEISSLGIVRSKTRFVFNPNNNTFSFILGRVITPRINNYGYVSVRLSKDGKTHTRFVHRLMGIAFIVNPENKKCINHKNGIKTDNRLENLEFVSHSENMIHAYRHGLISKRNRKYRAKMIKECAIEKAAWGEEVSTC